MSDISNQEKLEEIYKVTRETNEMIHSMLRQQYLAIALRTIYLLVIIGAIGGAYYYVRPIIAPVISVFTQNSGKIEETIGQLNKLRSQIGDKNILNEVIKNINDQVGTPTKTTP